MSKSNRASLRKRPSEQTASGKRLINFSMVQVGLFTMMAVVIIACLPACLKNIKALLGAGNLSLGMLGSTVLLNSLWMIVSLKAFSDSARSTKLNAWLLIPGSLLASLLAFVVSSSIYGSSPLVGGQTYNTLRVASGLLAGAAGSMGAFIAVILLVIAGVYAFFNFDFFDWLTSGAIGGRCILFSFSLIVYGALYFLSVRFSRNVMAGAIIYAVLSIALAIVMRVIAFNIYGFYDDNKAFLSGAADKAFIIILFILMAVMLALGVWLNSMEVVGETSGALGNSGSQYEIVCKVFGKKDKNPLTFITSASLAMVSAVTFTAFAAYGLTDACRKFLLSERESSAASWLIGLIARFLFVVVSALCFSEFMSEACIGAVKVYGSVNCISEGQGYGLFGKNGYLLGALLALLTITVIFNLPALLVSLAACGIVHGLVGTLMKGGATGLLEIVLMAVVTFIVCEFFCPSAGKMR